MPAPRFAGTVRPGGGARKAKALYEGIDFYWDRFRVLEKLAIPSVGGMTIEVMTMLVVPVLYCAVKELRLQRTSKATSTM